MPGLSLVKVSRRLGQGQIEIEGNGQGKTDGADKKSRWMEGRRRKRVEVVPKRDEATVQMPNWFAVFFFEDA
jgi:hypothetical protein